MIFVIDDDDVMAGCIARACGKVSNVKIFSNVISAMQELDNKLPNLIFLDILLDGPDGFTFLNELASYADTAKIPIVIVSSLDLNDKDLSMYGVVEILNKNEMYPEQIKELAVKFCGENTMRKKSD